MILRTLVFVLAFSAALLGCTKKAEPAADVSRPVDGFVVADGVKLHYLDWGGDGEAVLFLAGFGDDAHVFHSFAPKFTDRFHAYALTRRGFGKSDKPAGGYDTATRVDDIRAFLDDRKIERVHLVGHSMAGDELTLFATRFLGRVHKLVYLDAAYDRYHARAKSLTDPAMTPLQKRMTLEAIGSLEAAAIVAEDPRPADDQRVWAACARAIEEFQHDYRGVRAPALAFYATISSNHPASANVADVERRKEWNAWWAEHMIPWQRTSREQFQRQMRDGEIVDLPDAHHHLFRGKSEDQVARKTHEFLSR